MAKFDSKSHDADTSSVPLKTFSHNGQVEPEDEEEEDGSSAGVCARHMQRLKTDRTYRDKCLLSISICFSFVFLGWLVGQVGPSFLDLQIITRVGLEEGSFFIISGSVGYLLGSMIGGAVFDRFNKLLLVFLETFLASVVMAIIPFCSIFELMLVALALRGFLGGALDSNGNALLLAIWSGGGRSFMQALHFSFAFGGIISPLATAPFLLEKHNFTFHLFHSEDAINMTLNVSTVYPLSPNISDLDTNNKEAPLSIQPESQLYKAYLISAGIAILVSVPLFVFLLYSCSGKFTLLSKEETLARKVRDLPLRLKVLCLCLLVCFFVFYCAVEDTFNSYLTAFCVMHFDWTKAQGSILTSVYWASYGLWRFLGIFVVKLFQPRNLLIFFTLSLFVSFIGVMVSSHFRLEEGLWVSTVMAGFGMSILFPTMFTWTEEKLLPVTGKIASLFLIAASAGSMLNPIILGYLMERSSPLWFPYLLLGESGVVVIILATLLLVQTKYISGLGVNFRDIQIEVKEPGTSGEGQMFEGESLLNLEQISETPEKRDNFSDIPMIDN